MPVAREQSAAYAALPEAHKLIAQVYAAVYPQDPARSRVVRWLAAADLRVDHRRVTTADTKTALDELHRAGIVCPGASGSGPRATLEWVAPLAIEAHRLDHLEPILAARQNDFLSSASYWATQDLELAIKLRFLLVSGRAEEIHGFDRVPPDAWKFLVAPGAEPLLRALPAEYLDAALSTCLAQIYWTAAPADAFLKLCVELLPDSVSIASDSALVRVLQGRFDAAVAIFDDLPRSVRESKFARVDRASTLAFIATLRGDDEAALAHIDAAVAAEKSGTRKRNVFPGPPAFALSLLALLRVGTPKAVALFEHLRKSAEKTHQHSVFMWCVNAAAGAQTKSNENTLWLRIEEAALPTLLTALAGCWRDRFLFDEIPAEKELLVRFLEQARSNGFAWVVAEGVSALERAGSAATIDDFAGSSGADLHQALGTVSLTGIVQPIQEWEYPLKALEQLAYKATKKPVRKRASRPAKPRRLVWEIVEGSYGEFAVRPREQLAGKNGTWSRGRTVSLKRLQSEAANMEFLLDQDRAVAAAVKKDHYGYGWGRSRTEYVVDERGLFALAGHPNVYDQQGQSIEIVRREPELVIDENPDGQLCARIEPGNEFARNYMASFASATRLEVTRFTAGHKRLFEIIPPEGLQLPMAARTRLLEAVSALASEIRVHSRVAGGEATGAKSVEADPQPVVELVPAGAGLSVTLLVEPVPQSKTYFGPGQGGATVFVNRDGEPVETRRDMLAERNAAEALIANCPVLARSGAIGLSYQIGEPEDCLNLIDQLQNTGARCLWPKDEPYRIVARSDTPQLSLTVKSAADWFEASGELALDEAQVVGLERLFVLLDERPRSRFLELESGQFLALSETFRHQLDELRALSKQGKSGVLQVHPLATLALDDLFEASDTSGDAAWQKLRKRLRDAETLEPELPSTLRAELRPYQHDGFLWLARLSRWGVGACLADDMGLGKTVQALALLLHRAADGPALVIAPTSVAPNWLAEARRFAPTLRVLDYMGPPAERRSLLDAPAPFDLVVTTYGLLQNDIDRFAEVSWDSVVLDEAQAIKNAATRRARAVRRLDARFRLATTGTPIQNNLMDLHSLFAFLNPGFLGSAARFKNRFVLPIERDRDAEARAHLRRLIAPFILRRTKSEVLDDLPSRTEITLSVELSGAEAALYEALRRRALDDLEQPAVDAPQGERQIKILAHLTRLRLACCHPRLVQDSWSQEGAKLGVFADTIRELLANQHKVLVFSQFVMHLKLIEAFLADAGIPYQYLDGRTPAKARTARIAAFQAGKGDVFLISLKAGGTGLNLTAADYVIHMDPWWNPAVEDQASDRAHRIGQTRPVTIYRMVTKGTIEEQIVELHRSKRDLADRLLSGADAPARLNAEELLNLIRTP